MFAYVNTYADANMYYINMCADRSIYMYPCVSSKFKNVKQICKKILCQHALNTLMQMSK